MENNVSSTLSICTHYMENFNGLTLTYRPHSGNKGDICLQPAH